MAAGVVLQNCITDKEATLDRSSAASKKYDDHFQSKMVHPKLIGISSNSLPWQLFHRLETDLLSSKLFRETETEVLT